MRSDRRKGGNNGNRDAPQGSPQRMDTYHGLRFQSKRRSYGAVPVTARAESLTLRVNYLSGSATSCFYGGP